MKNKCIKVKCDNNIEFYYKLKDIAEKYNITIQHISGILNGKTKRNFFIYNEKIVYLEYMPLNDDQSETYKKQHLENKKIYNKRAYEKRKNNIKKIKNSDKT
jgi:hypothetical protein